MHAITLRIRVNGNGDTSYLTDCLGECARELEAYEADNPNSLGLIPDDDDPGRYWWEIVAESYPS